ncbi:hypothetical protein [Microbulbifer sp. SH-1]|uniref:hypothetical protein n=1 Tax=Microbulbifer sp. SH-1 TaxID=2681547 RepID=UPI0035303A1F
MSSATMKRSERLSPEESRWKKENSILCTTHRDLRINFPLMIPLIEEGCRTLLQT